ncbi:MAG: Peptidoglycan glycosyltransferase, partial [Klenkia sp.]|nr:Peptidoglycan glycosyltransferase [Klenkia sp.]
LSQADRDASVYPPVREKTGSSLGVPTGPEGLIIKEVVKELGRKGYSEEQVYAGGLRITTTVDKHSQDVAVASVNEARAGQPETLRQALVAIDPRTGGVRAYYGGASGVGNDYAKAQRQPGSSMKPYVLATALEQGISVTARRDGSNGQTFLDRPDRPVYNAGGASCYACTLENSLVRSLNTTFYGLAYEVGPDNVAETARLAAGLPEVWEDGLLKGRETLTSTNGGRGGSIGIGEYEMRPIDQAHGFATLAAGGVERDPFFVLKVADSAGGVLLANPGDPGEQVIAADVAADVTYAMTGVAEHADRTLAGGREVACKTGTQGWGQDGSQNTDAWMVGFTPSLSAAVWVGSDQLGPIQTTGGSPIYGSGMPGEIWQSFMDRVLEGTPEEDLPDEPVIDGDTGEGVPEPTVERVPTPAPTTTRATPSPVEPQEPVVENPGPETPGPVTPGPVTPGPENPDPENPDPENPDPENPNLPGTSPTPPSPNGGRPPT